MAYRGLAICDGGALFPPPPPKAKTAIPWVNGAKIAEAGYYRSLLKGGVLDSMDFFEAGADSASRLRHSGKPCRRIPLLRLPQECRARRYDALLTEFSEAEHWGLRARYLPNASVIAIMHAMNMQHSLLRIATALLWDLYRPYDAMVCSSETARRTISAMFDRVQDRLPGAARKRSRIPKLTTIPFGIDPSDDAPSRDEARRALGFAANETVILSFGRITVTDKADYIAMLVPIARLARRLRPRRIKVIVAGVDADGLAPILRSLAGGMGLGSFLSIRPNPDYETRARLYRAADIFVSLSDNIQETFGLTILEAMTHGLPVVASDWGGYRDIVIPGVTGLLVRTSWTGSFDDLDSLAGVMGHREVSFRIARRTSVDSAHAEDALYRLIAFPELRRRMGEEGLKRARREYAWPVIARRHRALWRELRELAPKRPLAATTTSRLPGTHDHAAIFGHYPTALLSGQTRLARIRDPFASKELNPLFQIIGANEITALKSLARAGARGAVTVKQHAAFMTKDLGTSEVAARETLLLAIKYGLLQALP